MDRRKGIEQRFFYTHRKKASDKSSADLEIELINVASNISAEQKF